MRWAEIQTKGCVARLHPAAASAFSRVRGEWPELEVEAGTMHLFEFLSRQRPGKEPRGFPGFSGHLFGLCLDFRPPSQDREEKTQEMLRAFGWVALDAAFPWHMTYAGHNWRNYQVGGEAARVLEMMRPDLDTLDPKALLSSLRLLPANAPPAVLREALCAVQRTFGIEETGEPCLRTRAVLLALHA